MNERQKRLIEVYEHLRRYFGIHTKTGFAESLHYGRTSLSAAMNGDEKYLTDSLFKNICEAFPGMFDIDYLLTGNGQLLTIQEEVKSEQIEKESNLQQPISYADKLIASLEKQVKDKDDQLAVTLDRIITRFRATITDAIPDGTANITIAPASWHLGLNYTTGLPTTASTTFTSVITLPNSYTGQTNTLLNLYGFSTTSEWTTDITLTAKKSNNDVLGTATIEDVPFKANRSSDYSGSLFGQSNSMGFTLNSDWNSSYNGSW